MAEGGKSDWEAWNARSLAEELIVRFILTALSLVSGSIEKPRQSRRSS